MLPRTLKNLSLRRIKWRQPVGKLVGWNVRHETETVSVGDDLLLRRLEATLTRHVRNQNLIDRMKHGMPDCG